MARVEGVDAVSRVFRRLPKKARDRIALALTQGAAEIVAAARVLAPVGDDESKRLRDDIKATEPRETRRGRGVAVYVVAGGDPEVREYARLQEFGRAPSPDGHPGHLAQPYLFPAYAIKRRRVRARLSRALNAAVKDVTRGG